MGDVDGGEGSDLDAFGFDRVLEGESVDDGAEHAGVVGGHAGHAGGGGDAARGTMLPPPTTTAIWTPEPAQSTELEGDAPDGGGGQCRW